MSATQTAPITAAQVAAAVRTIAAIGEAIRELQTVPEGVLYAQLSGTISLSIFTAAIGHLVDAGLVVKSNNVLTWKDPA